MNWLLDIFLALIFVLITVVSTYKGFVKSVWSSVTVIGSFIIAYLFGPVLGEWICVNYVLPYISAFVFGKVEQFIEKSSEQYNISALFENLPEEFVRLAENCGSDIESLKANFLSGVMISEEELYEFADSFAMPISRTVSNAAGIIAVFAAAVIVLWLAGLIIKLIAEIPVIRALDGFLGFVLGIVKGLIIVWVLCVMIGIFVERGFMDPDSVEVLMSLTDHSYIFKFFCALTPVNFINIQ